MRRMRIIISFMLVLVILSSMTISIYGAEAISWSDKAIENAVANGLFNSATAKSMANVDLSRAEMAAVINRAFGSTSKASLEKFTDVPKDTWYYDDMAKAVNMGIFNGSNGMLRPKSKITREEAFAVIARAIKLPGTDPSILSKFSDATEISSWAEPEISAMVKAGYIEGSGSKLNPKGFITRAQFAQIMDNLVKGYIKAAGTYTSVPNGNIMINTPGVTLKGVTVSGDLIIGDGVGNGEVTLDSVKVTGRTVIRGGGVNSIRIIGNSSLATVAVCRVDGQVRVVVSGGSNVQVIVIDDGSDDVSVEGTIGSVVVNASGITVTANNAKIGTVSIEAKGVDFTVGAGSSVDKLTLDASGAKATIAGTVKIVEAARTAVNAAIIAASTGKIDSIKTEAAGTTVTGTGIVTKVEANANDVKVETPNTAVTAGPGTTGVTAGGKAVEAGSTVNTTTTPPPTTGTNNNNNGPSSSISGIIATAAQNSNKVNVKADYSGSGSTAKIVLVSTSLSQTKEINDVPIVAGKIDITIYGLSNTTYTVKISVGSDSASAASPVTVFSPITTEGSKKSYLKGDFYHMAKGLELKVLADSNTITGGTSDYIYNIYTLNYKTGQKSQLTNDYTFTSGELLSLHSNEGLSIECNPEYDFNEGKYAVTLEITSSAEGNALIGESSFDITVTDNAPDLAIDYTMECITGYNSSTMEYALGDDMGPKGMAASVLGKGKEDDSDIWHSDVDWSVAGSLRPMIDEPFPQTIRCRYKATGSTQASDYVSVDVSGRPAAPTGLAAVSATQGSNGKITLLASADYQYKLYNASAWSDENISKTASAETYEISGLAAGTYYVRAKAAARSFASRTTALTVFAGGSTEPAAPVLVNASFNSDSTIITLKFDKAMSTTGFELSDFTVSGGSWEYYGTYQIASVGLKQGDNTSVELTLSSAPNYYPVRVAYTAGTAVAADGGVLAAFSNKNPDNMYLRLTIKSADEQTYGSIELDSIHGCNFNNKMAIAIADDSSTAMPAAGTSIWDKTNIRVMDNWYFPIYHANIAADKYLVLYTFDKTTGIITGFGQEKIGADDIGTACNSSQTQFADTTKNGANGIAKYVISFGPIGENQTVTITGVDADDVSTIAVPSTTPAYAVYTGDIAASGGIKKFTLTLSGDETNGQTNGTYNIEIRISTPTPYLMIDPVDKHKLNVTRARPGSEIVLYYTGNSYVYKTATADSNGNASFDDCEVHSEYYVLSNVPEMGLSSYQSDYVDITD
ncbi:MAG TPA: S-layer homology domain-containing protein [Clostridia bacterium]|nr:S-layer homology domain-containing protein [Clostridia bacterium]